MALAGLLAHRPRHDNFREICTCQKRLGRFARLRHHAGAIALGLPLTFCAVIVPVKALTAAAETRDAEAAQTRLRAIGLKGTAEIRTIKPVHAHAEHDLRATARRIDDIALETIRYEFFHNEVPYGPIIYREAKRHGFAPELIAAVVEVESDFRPTLVSPKNAQGLMQVLPPTGIFMNASDLMDPADNIGAGVRYLRYLSRRYSDLTLVLAAYNAGEGNVARFGGVPPFGETHNYLKRVARSRFRYQQRIAAKVAALHGRAEQAVAVAEASVVRTRDGG